MKQLIEKSYELRKDILDMVYTAKTGHIGGDFSVIDILTVLYYRHMNISPETQNDHNRDRFILSKGHSVEALYAVLADRGFFSKSELQMYSRYLSKYIGHPNNKVNGIEMNSGSLGHGLSVAVGMALAAKMNKESYRVYTVMGDGELAEGSVWEGVMAASHYKLDNLCAVVDRNRLQISGGTEEVMAHDDLSRRFESFGWNTIVIEGNNLEALDQAFIAAADIKEKPTVIIAETIKGYGVSFMENKPNWHHKIPSLEEYELAVKELEERRCRVYESDSKSPGYL